MLQNRRWQQYDKYLDNNAEKLQYKIVDAHNPQQFRKAGNLSTWNEHSTARTIQFLHHRDNNSFDLSGVKLD